MSVILIRETEQHVKETPMRHDEWVPTSQSAIFDIPLSTQERMSELFKQLFDEMPNRPQADWASAPMPAEYLVATSSTPAGTPCADWQDYVMRIQLTIEEYLDSKNWDYPGSPWQGMRAVPIAQALTWRAIDEALEIATSDEGIDWEWFDREIVSTLNKYIADLEALPDHDDECYEDRGEY